MNIFKKWNMGYTKTLAESGDRESAYKMGNYYYEGKIIEQNLAEAAKWYADASRYGSRRVDAERNGGSQVMGEPHPQAAERLAQFYRDGIAVNKNSFYAIELFATAIGAASDRMNGKERDMLQASSRKQGSELFNQLIEESNSLNAKMQYHLAYDYFFYNTRFFGANTKENGLEKGIPLLEKSFQGGYADAAYLIARYIMVTEKNMSKAFQWIKKGAECGGLVSQYELASKYDLGDEGIGIVKNKDIAADWCMKVCEHKDADFLNINYVRKAMSDLGSYYSRKKEYAEAIKYLKQATSPSNPLNPFDYIDGDSFYSLGSVYKEIGHKNEAQKMFKICADYYGDIYAMQELGMNRDQIKLARHGMR